MATGDISIRIRISTWRFRLHLSRAQFRLWWWDVRLRTREGLGNFRVWLRPGLAPELNNWMNSPWLSRTAGKTVHRPIPLKVHLAHMTEDIRFWADTMRTVSTVTAAATEAFKRFSDSLAWNLCERTRAKKAT